MDVLDLYTFNKIVLATPVFFWVTYVANKGPLPLGNSFGITEDQWGFIENEFEDSTSVST